MDIPAKGGARYGVYKDGRICYQKETFWLSAGTWFRRMGLRIWLAVRAHLTAFFAVSIFLFDPALQAAEEGIRLKEVRIQGNLRVEEDGIRLHVKARPGDAFNPRLVDEDVKSIYRMGFFDDVRAELSPDGVLTYAVKERPYVREVRILGSARVGKDKIESALGVRPRAILDRERVPEGVERVKKLYSDAGYANARVEHAIELLENNQAIVMLNIEEGEQLLIQRISFEGNRSFSEGELRGLMATKEKWFLSFITQRGVLDQDILTNDVAVVSAHYYDHGYVNHKIFEPIIVRRREGIEVVIRIEEGDQYRVGKVEIGGDLIDDPHKLLGMIQLTSGQIFRGSRLREDITTLTERYANRGFAFAQVEPVTRVDAAEKKVDIALVIERGQPVHFNRILIAGNTKTRDNVIRRELTVAEQERFSGRQIQESRNALQRAGYFEDVQLTTQKAAQPDAVDLLVNVKEAPTGSFSVGAGFSSGDQFVFTTSISERNLFGRGQAIGANVKLGTISQDFVIGFTEPYFYDTRVSLGLDVFNTEREDDDFTSRKTGFATRTGYPLKYLRWPLLGLTGDRRAQRGDDEVYLDDEKPPWINYMRGGLAYELTREKISDVDANASPEIQEEKGTSVTSAMTPSLSYDSRDHFFNPTQGAQSSLGLKFAGLGGDNRFLKTDASLRWYYALLKDPNWGGTYTLSLGGTLGFGVPFEAGSDGEKDLPLFERYFPGGINSVHGFEERSLGPQDGGDPIGGDKQAIFNVELVFPILEQYGLRGVTFFDMGQAFRYSESVDLSDFRRSVGLGVRWLSPFGPLRVELGFPLNEKSGDETSLVGFSVGGAR